MNYLLLLNYLVLQALRYNPDPTITEEEQTNALIGFIVIFVIVFGSAIILYIKQRMGEE